MQSTQLFAYLKKYAVKYRFQINQFHAKIEIMVEFKKNWMKPFKLIKKNNKVCRRNLYFKSGFIVYFPYRTTKSIRYIQLGPTQLGLSDLNGVAQEILREI